jgi:UDP-glucose 4-epimerase
MTSDSILVTGGAGYTGSHTAVSLLEQGYDVILLDNLCNSERAVLSGIKTIAGKEPLLHTIDMQDREKLDGFFSKNRNIKAVVHFAALKAVGDSVAQPVIYYQNNLYSLVNLLQCMQQYHIPYLIFSSSATVYGEPDSLPIEESHPVKPALSPYGNTKKICEDIIRDTAAANPWFHAVSLRYFNPIGAHPSCKIGELPKGVPNNLMPFITQTAAGLRKELLVFGEDYATPDGTAVRDYIHVVDLAEAHVKALERLLQNTQKSNYEVFNLGTGRGYSVLEVIHSFEKVSGLKLPYRIVGKRPGDIAQSYAATALANRELVWKAQRGLDEMTSSAWNWEQRIRGAQNLA